MESGAASALLMGASSSFYALIGVITGRPIVLASDYQWQEAASRYGAFRVGIGIRPLLSVFDTRLLHCLFQNCIDLLHNLTGMVYTLTLLRLYPKRLCILVFGGGIEGLHFFAIQDSNGRTAFSQ
jgi:hypothetical protein